MHCACVETYEVGGCGLGCVCCGVRKVNRPVNVNNQKQKQRKKKKGKNNAKNEEIKSSAQAKWPASENTRSTGGSS